MKIGTFIYVIT